MQRETVAGNFLVVQASVENGETGVLKHLERVKTEYPDSTWRAEIEVPTDREFSDDEIARMKGLGVRCVRLHGEIGNKADDPHAYIRSEFSRLAKVSRKTGWIISTMCLLDSWIELIPWLMSNEEFSGVNFIVEHNARFDPTRDMKNYPELDELIRLLKQHKDRFHVKLCGINRMEGKDDPPGKMKALPLAVLALAENLPDNVIWGSDWPHVRYKGFTRTEVVTGKQVDLDNELSLLQKAISKEQFEKLMTHNPARLFK